MNEKLNPKDNENSKAKGDEILNLDYHVLQAILKSLNRTKTYEEAAKLLGVSSRSITRYKKNYDIVLDSTGKYVSNRQMVF